MTKAQQNFNFINPKNQRFGHFRFRALLDFGVWSLGF